MISSLLVHLGEHSEKKNIAEILVVDGGSRDDTVKKAIRHGARVITAEKGRAVQMNTGASKARGEILYFLHVDTLPPKGFDQQIINAVSLGALYALFALINAVDQGYETGCFRMRFDTKNPFLQLFAYLSRINHTLCRGGDQSLFVTKSIFEEEKGFNEAYLIYEDSELIRRLYQKTAFKVLKDSVVTSARKYREKGWLKVQFHFAMIHFKYYLGTDPETLYAYYKNRLLN